MLILSLLDENFKEIKKLSKNDIAWVLLQETPFYATSGGQIGDSGILEINGRTIGLISETNKYHGLILSKIKVLENELVSNTRVLAKTHRR